jgi:hypothetical protein
MKMLPAQLANEVMPTDLARVSGGNTSEQYVHVTGPEPMAKQITKPKIAAHAAT